MAEEERGDMEDRGEQEERTVDIHVTAGDLDPDPGTQYDVVQNTAQEQRGGSDGSKNNLYKAAAECLGLLCLLLLVVIIVLVIRCTNDKPSYNKLTEENDELKRTICGTNESSYNKLTEKHDELKRILSELSGWMIFGRGLYYISTEKKTWDDSRQYCRGNQSDLMVINSKEKQDFVISFNKLVWLGLTDKEEGIWTWVDGKPLTTPTYWGYKNPDNPEDHCVALVADGRPTKGWNDRHCSKMYHWICERVLY